MCKTGLKLAQTSLDKIVEERDTLLNKHSSVRDSHTILRKEHKRRDSILDTKERFSEELQTVVSDVSAIGKELELSLVVNRDQIKRAQKLEIGFGALEAEFSATVVQPIILQYLRG